MEKLYFSLEKPQGYSYLFRKGATGEGMLNALGTVRVRN